MYLKINSHNARKNVNLYLGRDVKAFYDPKTVFGKKVAWYYEVTEKEWTKLQEYTHARWFGSVKVAKKISADLSSAWEW